MADARTGLTCRIIPCLDVRAGRVVKGVRFQNLQDQGDPAEIARRYDAQGADEIVFLDVGAAPERRDTDLDWVRRTAEQVFIPLTVGGGVRKVEDAERLLRAGADKVALNSAAVADPELLTRLAERFGSQCVVLSVDARRRREPEDESSGYELRRLKPASEPPESPVHRAPSGARRFIAGRSADERPSWEVVTYGGRRGEALEAVEWIAEGVARGAGEVLLTSIDADGTRDGYDLELLGAVVARVSVPVIASGGAGHVGHLAEALEAGASAVLAASIFHQGDLTVGEVKQALADRGFPMREVVL